MAKTTHGQSKTSLHHCWRAMKDRVLNKNEKRYSDYGGRGIKICNSWMSFEPFMKWALSHGYEKGLSIDRINNNGNYSPRNCRWSTALVQMNNTRRNHIIYYGNEKMTMSMFCRKHNLNYALFNVSLQYGMTTEDAMIKSELIKITSGGRTKEVAKYSLIK